MKPSPYTTKLSAQSSEIEEIAFFDYSQRHLTGPVGHIIFDDLHAKDLLL
ncbi:MAG: hypothetical protein JWL85_791 [Candidatus Saccharibacteria bacterium]|nr:hypothetical protein [Candidatus Saccharibacteria bacterium]